MLYTLLSSHSNVIYVKRDSKIFISNKPYKLIATDPIPIVYAVNVIIGGIEA